MGACIACRSPDTTSPPCVPRPLHTAARAMPVSSTARPARQPYRPSGSVAPTSTAVGERGRRPDHRLGGAGAHGVVLEGRRLARAALIDGELGSNVRNTLRIAADNAIDERLRHYEDILTNGETHTLDNGSSVKAQASGETLLEIIRFLASVLQEGRKSTNIHAGLAVIRGIPAKEMVDTTAESPIRAIRCDPDWEVDQ